MSSTPEALVIQSIQKLGVPFEPFTIDPAFSDTALFCEKYGYPLDQTINTIIVASKKEPKQFCACAVLSNARLDVNKMVTRLMGVSKASFATAEEMQTLTGMQVGGVTPFSLPEGLPIYVDSRVMLAEWVIVGGGGRGIKVKISPEAFVRIGAQIVEGLAL